MNSMPVSEIYESFAADYVWHYLLTEKQLSDEDGLREQAWQYVSEFSPDYM